MEEEKDVKLADEAQSPDSSPAEPEVTAAGEPSDEAAPDVPAETPAEDAVVNEDDASEKDAEQKMMDMLNDLPNEEPGASPEDINFGSASVSNAQFQQLSAPAGKPQEQGIDLLMDVNLPVSIELGRTKIAIAEILALGPGSVVELNKLAGEPVDVLVNFKVVARGEVVVVDENFGVRITQLLTPEERLRILGEE